jgi:hypothetical protein
VTIIEEDNCCDPFEQLLGALRGTESEADSAEIRTSKTLSRSRVSTESRETFFSVHLLSVTLVGIVVASLPLLGSADDCAATDRLATTRQRLSWCEANNFTMYLVLYPGKAR